MNEIAKTLRTLARDIVKTKAEHLKRKAYNEDADWGSQVNDSPYICDGLDYFQITPAKTAAHRFVHGLGMGRGLSEFSPGSTRMKNYSDADYEDCQSRRIAWLLFAADIAQEWRAT